MANDREVLREVWEGKLPVCFKLDPDEVADLQQPDPFYLMVPRLSYFPLVTDKVRKHFQKHISTDKQDQEMWLEYNGQPLKWHFPIGVLYDLLVDTDTETLPWVITVHFDKFPETKIYRFSNKETVEAYFMSCIKEADVLKHRGQIATNMQKKDHNQLWLGLQNGLYIALNHNDVLSNYIIVTVTYPTDKFDQFWAVNRKLMELSGENNQFKYIPFRCYFEDIYRQKLIKPVKENGSRTTLKDLLDEMFPGKTDVVVKTHGLIPPLDTPLQWMSEHLSYPDNFLHLCVVSL